MWPVYRSRYARYLMHGTARSQDRSTSTPLSVSMGFLRAIAVPTFTALAAVLPSAKPLLDNVNAALRYWSTAR